MHELLTLRQKVSGLAFLLLASAICICLIQHANPLTSGAVIGPLVSLASKAATLAFLVLLSIGHPRVWHYLYRGPVAWFFGVPAINGKWTGALRSNFARLDALRAAARDASLPRLDADSPEFLEQAAWTETPVQMNIKAGLFAVRIDMETGPATRDKHPGIRSSSVTARLRKNERSELEAWYIYEAESKGDPAGDDSAINHRGAAVLVFAPVDTAHGTYWTARNFRKGMNTAGYLDFTRVLT